MAETGPSTVSGDTSPLISEKSSGSENFEELGGDEFELTTNPLGNDDVKIVVNEPEPNEPSTHIDDHLPETVTLLRTPEGGKVYLIGTAHFSIESQNDVSNIIQAVEPDVVVVELCSSRLNILQLDEETIMQEAKNINSEKVIAMIRQNGLTNGIMYLLFLNMSAHITKELGIAPGGEFRTAFNEAKKIKNCSIHLGDRPISITLQRALKALSWWQTIKLAWRLLTTNDSISKEDVEKCKQRDLLEQLISEMAGEFPALGEVFVNERNIYLTHSIQCCSVPQRTSDGNIKVPKVVGVVGIGHVPGILNLWGTPQDHKISDILIVPPPTLTSKVLKFTIRLGLITLVGYTGYKGATYTFRFSKNLVFNFIKAYQ